MMNVGNLINKLLRDKGLKKADLARKMDVTPGYITQLITGDSKPGRRTIEKLAKALEVNPSLFFGEDTSSLKTPSEQRLLEVLREHDITKPEELEFALKDLRRRRTQRARLFLLLLNCLLRK